MKTGTVRWFNSQKGHGYIRPDDGGPNIFIHLLTVEKAGLSELREGQRFQFDTQVDQFRGCESAVSLERLEIVEPRPQRAAFTASPEPTLAMRLAYGLKATLATQSGKGRQLIVWNWRPGVQVG